MTVTYLVAMSMNASASHSPVIALGCLAPGNPWRTELEGRQRAGHGKKTVGFIAASLVQFAGWAIREESTGITTQVGPEITFCESFRDLSVSQVEHAVVGETNQRLSSLGWDEYAEIL